MIDSAGPSTRRAASKTNTIRRIAASVSRQIGTPGRIEMPCQSSTIYSEENAARMARMYAEKGILGDDVSKNTRLLRNGTVRKTRAMAKAR